jgi:hypothetical protein
MGVPVGVAAATALVLFSSVLTAAPRDPFCEPLRAFAASVKPSDTRKLAFHTSWGSGFKDAANYSLYAKRCDHGGYAPAKAACDVLLQQGSAEFAGNNALRVIACLSPATRFAPRISLDRIEMTLTYGSDSQGSDITVRLDHDAQLGGEVLSIEARGYGDVP